MHESSEADDTNVGMLTGIPISHSGKKAIGATPLASPHWQSFPPGVEVTYPTGDVEDRMESEPLLAFLSGVCLPAGSAGLAHIPPGHTSGFSGEVWGGLRYQEGRCRASLP